MAVRRVRPAQGDTSLKERYLSRGCLGRFLWVVGWYLYVHGAVRASEGSVGVGGGASPDIPSWRVGAARRGHCIQPGWPIRRFGRVGDEGTRGSHFLMVCSVCLLLLCNPDPQSRETVREFRVRRGSIELAHWGDLVAGCISIRTDRRAMRPESECDCCPDLDATPFHSVRTVI